MTDTSDNKPTVDIGRQQVGAVYAKALLGTAEKQEATDHVISELEAVVSELLERFPRFDETLSSPRLSADEKSRMIDSVLGPRVSELLSRFLKVVCAHGRLDCLREISLEARRQVNDRRGVKQVQVVTAAPVGDDLVGQISERLRQLLGCEVQLQQSVDEGLIGGLVIRIGDKVYDGSVANQLNQVRAEALDKTTQQMRSVADRFAVANLILWQYCVTPKRLVRQCFAHNETGVPMKFNADEIASVIQQEIDQYQDRVDVREGGNGIGSGRRHRTCLWPFWSHGRRDGGVSQWDYWAGV